MSDFAAAGALTSLALRRDRVLLAVWIVVLAGMVLASAAATPGLYPTESERVAAATALNNSPAIVALYGPIVEPTSMGEIAMTKMTVLYAVVVAILALVLVRRHLRSDEESGRAELVMGAGVGHSAPLTAALAEAAVVAVALGLLAAGADIAAGLPARGSVVFGLTWTGTLLVFAAATAVACQLSASARTCAGIASAFIALAYVLRAVGDISVTWLSWLSPLGWNTLVHAWSAHPRWWLLAAYPLLAGALTMAAVVLRSRRDLGSGLWADRPGPAEGSPRLADAVALAWRTTRGTLGSWLIASVVFGAVFGAMVPNIADLLTSSSARDMMARIGGEGAVQDTMVGALLGVTAVIMTCFGVIVIAHGGTEELDGRTEQVLATRTSRSASFLAVAVMAFGGTAALVTATGVAMAVGFGGIDGSVSRLGEITAAALVNLPAVWCVVALTLLAFALRSSWTWLGWALVTTFITLGELGELLRLPRWLQNLSPYAHTPRLPAQPLEWTPLVILTCLAVAVAAVAWWRYRVRDIG